MRMRYYTCDVFTETRFGGNPLAVLPEANGLSDKQMQQIAREFNLSETAFVFPPEAGQTRKVRIFTPGREIPFAGHPNVGTAFVLASMGELGPIGETSSVTFEEQAGLVSVSIRKLGGNAISCEVRAPASLSIGEVVAPPLVASALSLTAADLIRDRHEPQVVSVGLPFIITELKDRSTLERARVNTSGFDSIMSTGVHPSIYFYTRSGKDGEIRARMFAPLSGVPEDPATGSAGCAVAGLLAHLNERADGTFAYRIVQGVEMGRPSLLSARAEKAGGAVQATWIGGSCILVSEGFLVTGQPA